MVCRAASLRAPTYRLAPSFPAAGRSETPPAVGEAVEQRHQGGYLLALCREEDWCPLGFVTLRPRLDPQAANLVRTCRRHNVRVEMLAAGSPSTAQAVARRAGVPLVDSADAVAVVSERQQAREIVAFLSDSAQAAAGFAACDLGIGLAPAPTGQFPARADLLAPDLDAVSAILEAASRRERAVRDGVGFSIAANIFGVVWGARGRPGVERASTGIHVSALAALADGWLRLRGGPRPGSSLSQLIDPHPERWGRESIAHVLRTLETSETGLSTAQAKQRQGMAPRTASHRATVKAVLDQIRSPVNGILTGGAILSLIAGARLWTSLSLARRWPSTSSSASGRSVKPAKLWKRCAVSASLRRECSATASSKSWRLPMWCRATSCCWLPETEPLPMPA